MPGANLPPSGGWTSPSPVEPQAGAWRAVQAPPPQAYRLPPPPANHSPETARELEELHAMAAQRTIADSEQIYRWSIREASVNTHWLAALEQMIRKYKLSPPKGARAHCLLASALDCTMIACWRNKYHYMRPRPSHLDPSLDVSVIPVPDHPSYPAGHSAAAGAAATVLKHLFPPDAAHFDFMAEDSGISRLKAGIHYRSDHAAGLHLGRWVAQDVLQRS